MIEKVSKVKQAILFACCLAATGCKQAPQATVESGYKVITLAPTDRTLSSTYSATIRGRQDIEIYPQVSGTLTQVCVSEGERVKRGQSLFIIDQVPYEAALQTALANVEAAKASLATAQLTSAIGTDEGSGGERPEQLIVHIGKKSGGRSGGNTALPGRNVGECQSA